MWQFFIFRMTISIHSFRKRNICVRTRLVNDLQKGFPLPLIAPRKSNEMPRNVQNNKCFAVAKEIVTEQSHHVSIADVMWQLNEREKLLADFYSNTLSINFPLLLRVVVILMPKIDMQKYKTNIHSCDLIFIR